MVNTNKPGWAWLDQSYYTDQRYDITSGKLYQRLDEMKADLPNIDWVYVDVYFGTGWNARKLAEKLISCGWAPYTEFPGLFERYVTWNHTSQDWTQRIWGDGRKSKLSPVPPESDPRRLAARPVTARQQRRRLHGLARPARREDRHPLRVRREPAGEISPALCDSALDGQADRFRRRRDRGGRGRRVQDSPPQQTLEHLPVSEAEPAADGLLTFMPWDSVKETKIYHWNDTGGETTWDLPASWGETKAVRLYRLTDSGRVFVRLIPVAAGKVTLTAAPRTPYVLYKEEPPPLTEIVWGEGALVRDPVSTATVSTGGRRRTQTAPRW